MSNKFQKLRYKITMNIQNYNIYILKDRKKQWWGNLTKTTGLVSLSSLMTGLDKVINDKP